MKSADYWKKRAEARMDRGMAAADQVLEQLERAYTKASRELQGDIRRLYEKYGDEYGLSYADAIKYIDASDYKEWRFTLAEYVERIRATGDTELLKELDTLATRARVTRLQTLETAIKVNATELGHKGETLVTQLLGDTYEGTYYRSAYDFQRGVGVGSSLEMLSPDQVAKAISYPWSGADYSTRVWKNAEALTASLHETITQGLIQGKDVRQMTAAIQAATGAGVYNAQRLVRTETAYMVEAAELRSYADSGVEQYEILVSLDERTCKKCGSVDGQKHPVTDARVSVNYPPFHSSCRCTTVAYFGEDEGAGVRFARDKAGKGIEIPADMKYQEWYNKFIQPLPKTVRAPNASLGKQLVFRDDAGVTQFIPHNTEIVQAHVIAGKGTASKFREAQSKVDAYGGTAADWQKKVGKIESAKYIFDVHWVELDGKMYEPKIKLRKERAK